MNLLQGLTFMFLVLVSIFCNAQNAILVRKVSGDTLTVVVRGSYHDKRWFQSKSHSKTYLMTDIGNFDCTDIQTIILNKKAFEMSSITRDLRGKVNISFVGSEVEKTAENNDPFNVNEAISNNEAYKSNVSEIEFEKYRTHILTMQYQLENFRVQRQQGKQLQVVGALFTLIGSIIINSSKNTNSAGGSYLVIGGLGLVTVGFAIDWNAGKHLRKK